MHTIIPETASPQSYRIHAYLPSAFTEISEEDPFLVDMQYPRLQMEHAEKHCYVRREVYEHLLMAAGFLPEGYRFRILDAWRPFALQKELYRKYSALIIQQFGLEACTEEQRNSVIRKFVSEPVPDHGNPPVHTTGGAVDLTIAGPDGQALDMGSAFDEFSDCTYTAYYENSTNDTIRKNRRLLYYAMTSAGFTNLPSEWWHYDYGDRFWGYYKQKPILYDGRFTREELVIAAKQ